MSALTSVCGDRLLGLSLRQNVERSLREAAGRPHVNIAAPPL